MDLLDVQPAFCGGHGRLVALGDHDEGAEEVLGVDDAEDAVTVALFNDAQALRLDVFGEAFGVA